MLTLLGTIFGSIFSGGATGLLGVIFQRFADYKNKQLDMQLENQRAANELLLKQAEAEIMKQEWAARTQVAQIEGDTAKDVAASQAFAASFQMEPQRYSEATKLTYGQQWVMVLLDVFRGFIRPALTVYLCALTTMVYFQARALLGKEDLDIEQALELDKMIVGTILYLTTTIVLWWFGTRNKAAQPGSK